MPILEELPPPASGGDLLDPSAPCHEVARALPQQVSSVGFCPRVGPVQRLRALTLRPQELGIFFAPTARSAAATTLTPAILAAFDVVGLEEDQMTGASRR